MFKNNFFYIFGAIFWILNGLKIEISIRVVSLLSVVEVTQNK